MLHGVGNVKRQDLRGWLETAPVSGHAKFVYIVLLAHADGAGWSYPSVSTLAHFTGSGMTTVRAALRELETAGEVIRQVRAGHPTGYLCTANPNVSRWGAPRMTPSPGDGNPIENPIENPIASRLQKELEGIGRGNGDAIDADSGPIEREIELVEIRAQRAAIVGTARAQHHRERKGNL